MNYCDRNSNGFKHNMYTVMMSSAMTRRRRNTRKPSSSGWVTLVADLSPNKAGAKVARPRPHISTSWLPIMRKFPQSGFSNKALNQTRKALVWRSSKKTDHSCLSVPIFLFCSLSRLGQTETTTVYCHTFGRLKKIYVWQRTITSQIWSGIAAWRATLIHKITGCEHLESMTHKKISFC